MKKDGSRASRRLRAVCLFMAAMLAAFAVPLTIGHLTGNRTDPATPPNAREDSIVQLHANASAAPSVLPADACQLLHDALANRGGADSVDAADLVVGGSSARAAMASFPTAKLSVGQMLKVADDATAVSPSVVAARARLDSACQSSIAAPWGTTTAAQASFTVPFFVKAITAGAAQLATWLTVSSACIAAFNVAAIGCKPLADFAGGFIGALVFQSFDSKFGKITKGQVLNSFVSGIGAVPLGVIGRSNASHLLSRVFSDAGRWLQDSLLYHVPADLRVDLGSDIHGLAGIGV